MRRGAGLAATAALAAACVGLWIGWLYRNFDVVNAAGCLGNRGAVFAEPGEVKFDRLAENFLGVLDGGARRDTTRKIGYVAGKITFRLFNYDRVAHLSLTS